MAAPSSRRRRCNGSASVPIAVAARLAAADAMIAEADPLHLRRLEEVAAIYQHWAAGVWLHGIAQARKIEPAELLPFRHDNDSVAAFGAIILVCAVRHPPARMEGLRRLHSNGIVDPHLRA